MLKYVAKSEICQIMSDYVKICRNMLNYVKKREILSYLATKGNAVNGDLISSGILSETTIANYKKSLSQKGVVDTSKRGVLSFALPRFAEFVLSR